MVNLALEWLAIMRPETALDVKDFILFAAIHPPNNRNDKLPFISRKKDVGHVGQQDTP